MWLIVGQVEYIGRSRYVGSIEEARYTTYTSVTGLVNYEASIPISPQVRTTFALFFYH